MDEKIIEQAEVFADGMVRGGIIKARAKTSRPNGFVGICTCGADIPKQRTDLEHYNCTECQSELERRAKFFTR